MNLATTADAAQYAGGDDMSNIVVRSYTSVGSVRAIGSAEATVEAREGLIPGQQYASQSVRIEVTTGGDYAQTGVAVIDYDNIDKLLSALRKLMHTNITTDRYQFTEVEYETGELKIIVFNNDRGNLMLALGAGSVTIHFSAISKLDELKRLVETAKSHLDRHSIG